MWSDQMTNIHRVCHCSCSSSIRLMACCDRFRFIHFQVPVAAQPHRNDRCCRLSEACRRPKSSYSRDDGLNTDRPTSQNQSTFMAYHMGCNISSPECIESIDGWIDLSSDQCIGLCICIMIISSTKWSCGGHWEFGFCLLKHREWPSQRWQPLRERVIPACLVCLPVVSYRIVLYRINGGRRR